MWYMGKAGVQTPLSSEDQRWRGQVLAPIPCKGPISASLDPSSSKGQRWAAMSLELEMRCHFCTLQHKQVFCDIHSTCKEAKLSSSTEHGQLSETSISNPTVPSSLNGTRRGR